MANQSIEVILIMGPGGELQAGVPEGATFEQAAPALQKLFEILGRQVPITSVSQPESHRDGPARLHVHAPGINAHPH